MHAMGRAQTGERVAMSWDDYLGLGDASRAEYYDGHAVMSPSANGRHQDIGLNLAILIKRTLPESVAVRLDWGWRPIPGVEYIPDLVVFDRTDEPFLTSTPHLVVEVLSDDRGRDLLRKFQLYAEAGAPRYWVIDPDGPVITAFRLEEGTFRQITRMVGDDAAELDLGPCRLSVVPSSLLD